MTFEFTTDSLRASRRDVLFLAQVVIVTVGVVAGLVVLAARHTSQPGEEKKPPINMREWSLGSFTSETGGIYDGITNSTTSRVVSFDASVILGGSDQQLSEFAKLTDTHRYRLEAAVSRAIRSTSKLEMLNPKLDELRARMQREVNRVAGRQIVTDVLLLDFRVNES